MRIVSSVVPCRATIVRGWRIVRVMPVATPRRVGSLEPSTPLPTSSFETLDIGKFLG